MDRSLVVGVVIGALGFAVVVLFGLLLVAAKLVAEKEQKIKRWARRYNILLETTDLTAKLASEVIDRHVPEASRATYLLRLTALRTVITTAHQSYDALIDDDPEPEMTETNNGTPGQA